MYLTSTRSSTWVFDTGSVSNICNSIQGLRNKRQLARDEVRMRVGNGSKVDVIAIGTLPLHLPSGLVINLNNCYLVPALSMNIVFGSCLMQSGHSFKSENNGCSIYKNDIFYGHAPMLNGFFCWISIVILRTFIMLMLKRLNLIMIYLRICGTAV